MTAGILIFEAQQIVFRNYLRGLDSCNHSANTEEHLLCARPFSFCSLEIWEKSSYLPHKAAARRDK